MSAEKISGAAASLSTARSSKTAARIEAARAEGRAAFVGYLPAGYPDKESSIAAALELVRNGADVIEIGIPYSDPVMDGPVIQQATTEVLARGFRIDEVFEIVQAVTDATEAAVLVMTYYNLIDRMGAEEFARRLAEAGGAGRSPRTSSRTRLRTGSRRPRPMVWTGCSSPRRPRPRSGSRRSSRPPAGSSTRSP